jgi:aminopeptidase YwaD
MGTPVNEGGSMTSDAMSEKAGRYLRRLCLEIPSRRVGSRGNRAATDFFSDTVATFGFVTESQVFDCIDWVPRGAQLALGGDAFEVSVSPYSLGCHVRAPYVIVSTVEELDQAEVSDRIILLRGDIAREQLMPKNFPFYNPDEHKRIIQLLEMKKPLAIIAATSRDAQMAGAVYPFPLIEDGDFDIPSVYMTDEEGYRLAEYEGMEVSLDIRATRFPSTGCNVVARRGADPRRRVVLFAHIDAKDGTPGAIDNATGVVVLLLLAKLLSEYAGSLTAEIVALNGEDYYSGAGEVEYLSRNEGRFAEIALGVNLDGAGYHQGRTAYSLYDCPPGIATSIHDAFAAHQGMFEGERWYQSDHGLFLMNQRPALAITSERFMELLAVVAHTPKDSPEIVDTAKLVHVATALRDLVLDLDRRLA